MNKETTTLDNPIHGNLGQALPPSMTSPTVVLEDSFAPIESRMSAIRVVMFRDRDSARVALARIVPGPSNYPCEVRMTAVREGADDPELLPTSVVEALAVSTSEPDPLRIASLEALALRRDTRPGVVDLLGAQLLDSGHSVAVRCATAYAVGAVGGERGLTYLSRSIVNESPEFNIAVNRAARALCVAAEIPLPTVFRTQSDE